MKRILFVHHAHARTGACITLAHVLRALDRRRFTPVVVCPAGDSVAMFRDAGAEVQVSPRPIRIIPHVSGYSFQPWSRAFVGSALGQWLDRGYWRRFIAEQRVDLVHLNSLVLAPLAESARAVGVPVVCLVQETFADGLLGLRTRWLKRVLSTQLDGVWFISEYDRRAARSTARVIGVIPNWIDFDQQVDPVAPRAALGLGADCQAILFMGGVSRQKGTLTLLRALEGEAASQAILLLAGGREESMPTQERREIETRLGRLQREGRLRALGHVDDIARCYAAADAVVFCPPEPHQGRPLLEAATMSKPVIASDFDCVREFVSHGRNGLLVGANDDRALSRAIGTLLVDRERARHMGHDNHLVAMMKHNPRTNGARANGFYERVLGSA